MQIPTVLLNDIDYDAVVRSELSVFNRYLPPNLADHALRPHARDLANWLRTAMSRTLVPDAQEIVFVRKFGGGSRPLPFMGIRDRLAYRALVGLVSPGADGSRGDYGEFQQAPLEVDRCQYVLKADVTAFYQYVDHELLVDEVVAQTGDDLAIVSAVELLQGSTGRRFGLPQMSLPSDILSEIYLDPIRRDLVRAGFDVFCFADDFRVACPDYRSALAALELIGRSAFALGLVLNEGKTSTPKLDTYERSLRETAGAEAELFTLLDGNEIATMSAGDPVTSIENFFTMVLDDYDDVDIDGDWDLGALLGEFEGDDDDETDFEGAVDHEAVEDQVEVAEDSPPSERQVAASRLLLELWHSESMGEELPPDLDWSRAAWSSLLRKSLTVLAASGDTAGVEFVPQLLVYEPDLTPQVCRFLTRLSLSNGPAVADVLNVVCERESVNAWQSLWIAQCAGASSLPRVDSDAAHVVWLRRQLTDSHDFLVAQAALALARRRLLSRDEAAQAYKRVRAVHKPTAFLALAAVCGQEESHVPTANQIENWLAEWVEQQSWGGPPLTFGIEGKS